MKTGCKSSAFSPDHEPVFATQPPGVAKTVVDCFKFRHKVGQDVAIEALRDYLNEQRGSRSELYHYGKICRVYNVMRPYLDVLSYS